MTAGDEIDSEPEVMRAPSGRGGGSSGCASLRGGSLLIFDGAVAGDDLDGDAVLISEIKQPVNPRPEVGRQPGQLTATDYHPSYSRPANTAAKRSAFVLPHTLIYMPGCNTNPSPRGIQSRGPVLVVATSSVK